jgi:lia operon protein LiaG
MLQSRTIGGVAAAAALAVVIIPNTSPQGEHYDISGNLVAVYNLAGEIRLEAGSGSAVTVEVRRGGSDAGQLQIQTGQIGDAQTLRVIYPDDRVVYPESSGHWRTTVRVRDDGTFGDGNGRRDSRRVEIRSDGSGLEAYADMTIRIPRGQRFSLHHAAGEITATNVDGNIRLDSQSAPVTVDGARGTLSVDVGSGSIEVSDVEGDVDLDTGSGSVTATNVHGIELNIDTGSGSVDVSGAAVRTLNIDTGSGGVDVLESSAESVMIDTGSGGVHGTFTASPDDIEIDTGSGSVTLGLPADYSAKVAVETSSGDIDFDFPVQVRHFERNEVNGTIGSGNGSLSIDTGSGSVRIRKNS